MKEFAVSVNVSGIVKLTERGPKISDIICIGKFVARWMVNIMDKLREASKPGVCC